ncbi:hypothetical protein L3556_02640 [Candidatus Synechococcus calcipolaris G9]|uniref:CopG-like ribbon-helix-helix domain-containing protein n=1 Tax=Candidatus Synechococcus calcipolaris G9 TaxID=1497997 RepID=A0ABT6EXK3_9SYNE|nr:hypothetical protein [Candidatus Synechococcus calcipolaris]MDG2989838.1 hypothetical protein [Candidatus Synechococcus calcipolaris G9]
MANYKQIISQAKKEEIIQSSLHEAMQAGEMVNLCVRVPSQWRNHWKSEAAKKGISLGDYVIQAMKEMYGEPPTA